MTRDEADSALREAIRQHSLAYGWNETDDEFLNDYIVVSNWLIPAQSEEPGEAGASRYSIHCQAPNTLSHVAVGLLTMGLRLAGNGPDD